MIRIRASEDLRELRATIKVLGLGGAGRRCRAGHDSERCRDTDSCQEYGPPAPARGED